MNYKITEKRFTNEDNINYLSYGIQARDGLLWLEIDDVSLDRSEVESYIAALEKDKIPFCGIVDAIRNYVDCACAV
uniref:Uncharacterized protein n=1 Tax=uncultured Bacillota bacterium TaxID=344338 RepID=A0A650ENN5_9FIRM|nr:hypothetical protein Firmicute1046_3120 [uncultured Firmicutes bacterium]